MDRTLGWERYFPVPDGLDIPLSELGRLREQYVFGKIGGPRALIEIFDDGIASQVDDDYRGPLIWVHATADDITIKALDRHTPKNGSYIVTSGEVPTQQALRNVAVTGAVSETRYA